MLFRLPSEEPQKKLLPWQRQKGLQILPICLRLQKEGLQNDSQHESCSKKMPQGLVLLRLLRHESGHAGGQAVHLPRSELQLPALRVTHSGEVPLPQTYSMD